ncbi:hypothetical protein PG993_014885 [Apiospora rasikravindrae]|uniref:Uncharacterized protein n=1 Tax=Apiospora rasikravindrae TaxID=990691 RepID=A0ABR1RP04_9PEZI
MDSDEDHNMASGGHPGLGMPILSARNSPPPVDSTNTTSSMEVRKRSASVSPDELLQMTVSKHAKIEFEDTDHVASAPEDTLSPMLSDTLADIAMPDASSVVKQDREMVVDDGNMTLPNPPLLATANFQDTLDHLRKLYTEEQSKPRDLAKVDSTATLPECEDNSMEAISGQRNPGDHLAAQHDAAYADGFVTDSHELQDAKNQIEVLKKSAKEQNSKAEAQIQALRVKWQEVATELNAWKQQPSVKYPMTEAIDDSDIKSQFDVLNNRIKQTAKTHFSTGPWRTAVAGNKEKVFNKITPKWAIGIQKHDGLRKRYLFEAAIWHHFIDELLSRPLKIWSQEAGDTMLNLHKTIWPTHSQGRADKLRSFHSMRVHAAEVNLQVHGMNGHFLGDRDAVKKNTAEFFKDLVELVSTHTDSIEECKTDFQLIFEKAVELAYSMAMAKAQYRVRLGNGMYTDAYYGFSLKPASMQKLLQTRGDTVEFVVRLALLVAGNSEGEGYDNTTVLEKARVICD